MANVIPSGIDETTGLPCRLKSGDSLVNEAGAAAGGDMVLLYSTTLTSPTASITTGTLPTGYRSLVIDTSLRCDGSLFSVVVLGHLNGDTVKTNYQCTRFVMYSAAPIYGVLDYQLLL